MMQTQSVGALAAVERCKLMDTKTEIIGCLNGLIDQDNTIISYTLIFVIVLICVLGCKIWWEFR